jgi:hypothetical protein
MTTKQIRESVILCVTVSFVLCFFITLARADGWWTSQTLRKHCPSPDWNGLSVNIRGENYDIIEIAIKGKNGTTLANYGDYIHNGPMGCPIFNEPAFVVVSGTGEPTEGHWWAKRDVFNLYGIKSDGVTVISAFPDGQANGDVSVMTSGIGRFKIQSHLAHRWFCLQDDDWVQIGVGEGKCGGIGPITHSNLIAFRSPTAPAINIIRPAYYGKQRGVSFH